MFTNRQTIIAVPDGPPIPQLVFRGFCGEEDYPAMVRIINGSKAADGVERVTSVDDVARDYRHLVHCDPYRDLLFVQADGQAVGYSRVWWDQGLPELTADGQPGPEPGPRLYGHFAHLLPEWRGQGIRRAMLRWNERRLREIAAAEPPAQSMPRFFEAWAADSETHWVSLLTDEGYRPVRTHVDMVRPGVDQADTIPDLPLPEGVEVRPVQREQLPAIWAAAREAFRDEPGQVEWQDEWVQAEQESPDFRPELWQVAWDGDQVVGQVAVFVDEDENREYNRRRGYTEGICVRRPWRRRGVARALIARGLRLLHDMGMTEAALGANPDNPNGAVPLYESLGYRIVKRSAIYRKPLEL